jgi:phosphatidylglycerophosphatase C
MQSISIYDLDRTILHHATFTPFLWFAARQLRPWRLVFVPLWLAVMAGYKLKLYGRKPMKQFGIALFVGRNIAGADAAGLAKNFAAKLVPGNVQPGAAARIAADIADGRMLVLATAAPEIYATEIGHKLGFAATISTRHQPLPDGGYRHLFADENCYGRHKLKRVEEWLDTQGLARSDCHVRFYSDHHSDAPVLDWADEAVIVNGGAKLNQMAKARGWQCENWR